ncbi:MAG: 7-cyano-7-deazaguanine synthase, partial [Nitrososphaerota archaeon]|nr:7-cyano-7-deazaguanine synthase [Nitrososphaerota archaeon]
VNRGRLGGKELWISSPAKEGWSKAELIRRSYSVMGDSLCKTWSCYISGRYHCGECESCNNRRKAFEAAGVKDETRYAAGPSRGRPPSASP